MKTKNLVHRRVKAVKLVNLIMCSILWVIGRFARMKLRRNLSLYASLFGLNWIISVSNLGVEAGILWEMELAKWKKNKKTNVCVCVFQREWQNGETRCKTYLDLRIRRQCCCCYSYCTCWLFDCEDGMFCYCRVKSCLLMKSDLRCTLCLVRQRCRCCCSDHCEDYALHGLEVLRGKLVLYRPVTPSCVCLDVGILAAAPVRCKYNREQSC